MILLEKKQKEQNAQLKLYREWKRLVRDDIKKAHGQDFANLMRILRNLKLAEVDVLVLFVAEARWLLESDLTTRLATLSYIDGSLVRCNVRNGLPHFDDPLWDEPPNAFLKIRKMLTGV
ncbi:MAG: hypothetical protein EHM78_02040 [Myxococcaceae bacterium]|nr:MAG: hypothetical protein EHM78_02040 [Myxococcaceae bacterium]